MNILSTRGVLEQGACLDALIAIMLDSSSNQMVMFYFFIADSESMNRCPTFLCCYMSLNQIISFICRFILILYTVYIYC